MARSAKPCSEQTCPFFRKWIGDNFFGKPGEPEGYLRFWWVKYFFQCPLAMSFFGHHESCFERLLRAS